ncbi:MAG: thioesterase family protein [Gammaproteobacteria bacterium]|nr:thioesterase family protein [Gammaproteobacteria bacterium]
MQDTNLEDILTNLENSDSNSTRFSENWSQGRSAFGGLSAAFAVTAMRKRLTQPQTIRSLMVSFIAPVAPGEVKVEANILRQGKNVTQCSANVISGGQIALQAMAAFGNSRKAFKPAATGNKELPNRDDGIPFSDNAKRLPHFLQYFDGCWTGGGIPFSGNYKPSLSMWVRHKQDVSRFPIEKLVAIADIPPPVLLSHFEKPPVPASSLTWSLEFVEAPEKIAGEWFYLEFEVDAAADGYTQQSGEIYDELGRLVALTRQCMVYFG